MGEGTLHLIEDDLAEGALERWAARCLEQIEAYLSKHAAFLAYLDARAEP